MFKKVLSIIIIVCFLGTSLGPLPHAQAGTVLGLPQPGAMVNLSQAYVPFMLSGLTVHPENPLLIDFIVSTGNSHIQKSEVKAASDRLIKYFLACLTIPEDEQWVNLSPYEKDRIIPAELGKTALGRDMLAQDYILKQLTASLIYPERNLGKNFWDKVYAQAQEKFGTSNVPVNTFNKVWILPDVSKVYTHHNTVFVVQSHLKVMLDEDYLALQKHNSSLSTHSIAYRIVKEIILPAIENEVNTGKNFATLRQIYNSMILSVWYKKNLKEALLSQVYVNKNKIGGVTLQDKTVKDRIYQQYIEAYKKGVFNYIKEDIDQASAQVVPRKYFSGGLAAETLGMLTETPASEAAYAMTSGDKGQYFDAKISMAMTNPPMAPASAAMINPNKAKPAGSAVVEDAQLLDLLLKKTDPDKEKEYYGQLIVNAVRAPNISVWRNHILGILKSFPKEREAEAWWLAHMLATNMPSGVFPVGSVSNLFEAIKNLGWTNGAEESRIKFQLEVRGFTPEELKSPVTDNGSALQRKLGDLTFERFERLSQGSIMSGYLVRALPRIKRLYLKGLLNGRDLNDLESVITTRANNRRREFVNRPQKQWTRYSAAMTVISWAPATNEKRSIGRNYEFLLKEGYQPRVIEPLMRVAEGNLLRDETLLDIQRDVAVGINHPNDDELAEGLISSVWLKIAYRLSEEDFKLVRNHWREFVEGKIDFPVSSANFITYKGNRIIKDAQLLKKLFALTKDLAASPANENFEEVRAQIDIVNLQLWPMAFMSENATIGRSGLTGDHPVIDKMAASAKSGIETDIAQEETILGKLPVSDARRGEHEKNIRVLRNKILLIEHYVSPAMTNAVRFLKYTFAVSLERLKDADREAFNKAATLEELTSARQVLSRKGLIHPRVLKLYNGLVDNIRSGIFTSVDIDFYNAKFAAQPDGLQSMRFGHEIREAILMGDLSRAGVKEAKKEQWAKLGISIAPVNVTLIRRSLSMNNQPVIYVGEWGLLTLDKKLFLSQYVFKGIRIYLVSATMQKSHEGILIAFPSPAMNTRETKRSFGGIDLNSRNMRMES